MAVRPSKYPEWAESNITENVIIGTVPESLPNKVEPSPEFKISGELFRENLPRPYLNYQFKLISDWVKHFDARYSVGDIHLTTSADDATAIGLRLGGTWSSRGTQAVGSVTANVWEKIS